MSSPPTSLPSSAQKAVQKLDLAQVSLNLQDRLGLAKVRFEQIHRQRNNAQSQQTGDKGSSDAGKVVSNTLSEGVPGENGRYETPLPSSPPPPISRELPRSARSKHAATFDLKSMEAMTNGSLKRRRRNSAAEESSKVPRLSWESSLNFPQSSPTANRPRRPYRQQPNSFVSESDTIPDEEVRFPSYHPRSDDTEIDPDLPRTEGPNAVSSSIISSSPPRTPPPNRNRFSTDNKAARDPQGGADLLLYLANSPTPARLGGKHSAPELLPSTPPTQHATLPSLVSTPGGGVTANFATPTQPFNFADFVNVTPSPAQAQWTNRTPRALPKTPVGGKEIRKRLNFDGLAPPTGCSPASKSQDKQPGAALQLGDELRP